MTLPVTETLKLILAMPDCGLARPLAASDSLSRLFDELQRQPPPRPAHEIEDEIWARWTSHDDPALEARLQRAISAVARRRHGDAETLLDALVRDAPLWAEAWNKRATLYFLMQRDAEAIADIRTTLLREPRHFGAICGFGQICLRHGQPAAAAGAFTVALRINPHLDNLRATLSGLEPAPPTRLN
jgi:predicted Zn-dependent protease